MQKLILLSLLILTCSKTEFDKEISFDKGNNVFEFTTQVEGALFVYISFPISNLLTLKYSGCGWDTSVLINKPGEGFIYPFESGKTCKKRKNLDAPFNR